MTENAETKSINIDDLRTYILDYNDLPVKAVKVPEWGNITLYVRSMNGAERDSFMLEKWKNRDNTNEESDVSFIMENITAATLAKVICSDPEGTKKVFTDKDIEALSKKSAAALSRLIDAAKEVDGDLDDNEDIVKNLEGQSEDSGLSKLENQE